MLCVWGGGGGLGVCGVCVWGGGVCVWGVCGGGGGVTVSDYPIAFSRNVHHTLRSC